MPNIQIISRDLHAKKHWQRYTSYAFAANDALQPLLLAELSKAAMTLPIGFVEQNGAFVPVAVLGLAPRQNLLVGLDGRWAEAYVPAAFRGYPFRLGQTESGQQVLCIDEESGLITDGPDGEPFFGEDGQPAPILQEILNFLSENERSRAATVAVCAALKAHDLIRPWPITVKEEGVEKTVGGLFQIDEDALTKLPADALYAVAQSGGLGLAYCQLLSMQNLSLLGKLARARATALEEVQRPQPVAKDLNLDFLLKNETMNFGTFQ